jgi:PAS domain S-box-containing protein
VLRLHPRKTDPADEALQQSEERLRRVVESALDAVVTIDLEGRVTDWNARAEAMFGWSRSEILEETLLGTIIPPEHRAAHARGLERFRATGDGPALNRRIQLTALRRSGEVFPVELTITPLAWGGQTLAFCAFVRDITEQKRIEEELARSNAELEQFAYVASHDLQEPLRMVSSYLQLLARRGGDQIDSTCHQYLSFALDGSRRMQTMIEDLLAYSRAGGRAPYQMVDSSDALDAALANLGAALEQSGGTISRGSLPTLRADRTRLVELFQNLVGNAIKFRSADPPRVHVSAERRGEEWLFRITDNGIGIDPRYRERIFGLFQRLHTREEYQGSGMGLAICKRIVEHHGGTIWVESNPGAGSTFLFTLRA